VRKAIAAVLAGIIAGGTPLMAHHSFASTYFEDKSVTIQGKVMLFLFRNPHSFVQVEAKDDRGTTQTWAAEWGGILQLSRDGVTVDSLHIGDVVRVTGNPGRIAADHRLRLQNIQKVPKGFQWKGAVQ